MRTFAILLVLANLVFLGWNLSRPQDTERPIPGPASGQTARSLQLLDEVEVVQQSPETAEPQSCIALGVFNNTDESDFLVSALQERGIQARVELLRAGETRSYRVYMPPFNSNTAALQTLEALQAEGVESFIITSGALSGGISVGLFSQEALALGLQESLAAQGYATAIQEVVTTSNEIWVTIEGLSQSLLEGSELLDLLSEGLELEVIEKPCETIASSP